MDYEYQQQSEKTAAVIHDIIEMLTDSTNNTAQIFDIAKLAWQLKDSLHPIFKEKQGKFKAKFGIKVSQRLADIYIDQTWPDEPGVLSTPVA